MYLRVLRNSKHRTGYPDIDATQILILEIAPAVIPNSVSRLKV